MLKELTRVRQLREIQDRLDADTYVQQYIVRSHGFPDTYKGQQTQQKLNEILNKCKISFAGKSFIDLGCNKGFFPLYAAACGAYRSVGIDPDQNRIKLANEIATVTNNSAVFFCGKYTLDIAEELGVFDIVYIGSAYHYFWLDYRRHRDARDHERIFQSLAMLTSEAIIFEGCTNLDDEQWRLAALKATGDPEGVIREEFNDEAILSSARRYFDVTPLGRSGHAVHRQLYLMRKSRVIAQVTPPQLKDLPTTQITAKSGDNRAGADKESVGAVEFNGCKYLKKVLSKNRSWCKPALETFQRCFREVPPASLAYHFGMEEHERTLTLFQEYIENAKQLSTINSPSFHIRQLVLKSVLSMQRDLLTAGLIHIDIHATNILLSEDRVTIIDFEGLVLTSSAEYQEKFAQFYTLNFLAFLEAVLSNSEVTRDLLRDLPGVGFYGGKISPQGIISIMEHLKCSDPEVRMMYREILLEPELLININLYELLLRRLPYGIKPLFAKL